MQTVVSKVSELTTQMWNFIHTVRHLPDLALLPFSLQIVALTMGMQEIYKQVGD